MDFIKRQTRLTMTQDLNRSHLKPNEKHFKLITTASVQVPSLGTQYIQKGMP